MEEESIFFNALNKIIALGNYDSNVYYVLVFLLILCIYVLIHPVITWFIHLQSTRFLSYLFTSFVVIIFGFIMYWYLNIHVGAISTHLFKLALQCLTVFGITLFIYNSLKWKGTKRR